MSTVNNHLSVQNRSWQDRLVDWISQYSQPDEGWGAIVLSLAIIRIVGVAIRQAEWVPEITAVPWLTFWSLLLSFLVAKRVASARRAWFYLVSFGVIFPFLTMANLWPTGIFKAPPSRINLLTFLFRMRSWAQALLRGEATSETAVFTFFLLIGCWLLIACFGWMTFRQHRPMSALMWLALGLGINAYFGAVRVYLLAFFALFSLALLVTIRQRTLEVDWRHRGVEYSRQIGERIYQYGIGMMVVLFVVALFLQNARSLGIAFAFAEWPPIKQAESWLEQAFGGVNSDRVDEVVFVGQAFASVLPRSYLLGNAPELYENVVMTARVALLEDSEPRLPHHWRAASYDIYTGGGWARGDETGREIPAGVQIAQSTFQSTVPISQTISWLEDNRTLRYSLGTPLLYDDEVTTYRNKRGDLMWIGGELPKYTAVSQASNATPTHLRVASLGDVEPDLIKRYTQLPSDLPSRVSELATEIVAGYETPYDQAKAIEQFVRQYPYSLDVSPPPEGRDVVDFFLFDLQSGYCDYYATAMVVLARSVGLPARMGTGFVTHTPDENGLQTIYEIDGHSWAEVYFAGFGWIEFEPTAGFLSPDDGQFTAVASQDEQDTGPIALPVQDRSWFVLIRNVGLLGIGLWGFGRFLMGWLRFARLSVGAEYHQLVVLGTQLGLPISDAQTPIEMEQVWITWLSTQRTHPIVQFWIRLNGWLIDFREYVHVLVRGYIVVSYSEQKDLTGKRPLVFLKFTLTQTLIRILSMTENHRN